MPKKSKKNKYFFIAHPEALTKKEHLIQNGQDSDDLKKFVIDREKIKLNEKKKAKKEKRKKS